ncbi:low molecular weight phosphotyrosine protein phosphatase [Belliella sp. DSM 111904]|uniref:protein-tyrosine-phosphatase n=1 Tax=Belliella filtrata TaxID=2923435 RepID=A0ABS9V0U8_9BACT|nr:low molecular weight protein-tyrosine-phosphatase [Belliella filtrata]MCH7409948.1 low molecular weight phosphotyrosine protein phosphatase [Belliella filtrata]
MVKVLFVCLGNICRSPLAEAIFEHKVKSQDLTRIFKSDSCGTSDYHIGELPDERTIKCARQKGIEINHRGRQINRVDIREFNYILAMDKSNKVNIEKLINRNGLNHNQLHLIREFQSVSDSIEVPDPYYGGMQAFEEVYEILDDSIDHFLEFLKQEHQTHA